MLLDFISVEDVYVGCKYHNLTDHPIWAESKVSVGYLAAVNTAAAVGSRSPSGLPGAALRGGVLHLQCFKSFLGLTPTSCSKF